MIEIVSASASPALAGAVIGYTGYHEQLEEPVRTARSHNRAWS